MTGEVSVRPQVTEQRQSRPLEILRNTAGSARDRLTHFLRSPAQRAAHEARQAAQAREAALKAQVTGETSEAVLRQQQERTTLAEGAKARAASKMRSEVEPHMKLNNMSDEQTQAFLVHEKWKIDHPAEAKARIQKSNQVFEDAAKAAAAARTEMKIEPQANKAASEQAPPPSLAEQLATAQQQIADLKAALQKLTQPQTPQRSSSVA